MSPIAGQQLKRIREELGLSMREVEAASAAIATKFENQEFLVPISRLSDIETKGILPSIFKVFSLSAIYGKDYRDLCILYGVDFDSAASAHSSGQIRKTHRFSAVGNALRIQVPIAVDPGFDIRRTTNVVRMIQKWGALPASFLSELASSGHTYAFVGTEDFTMYPIVLPGSFLQIDEDRSQVINDGWRSEYERPIYCIETREELICAWCKIHAGHLMTQPHPLSPTLPRSFRYPQEAEVIGQVIGIAMRLDEFKPTEFPTTKKPQARLN
jgi:transcriptional regulator with XRE-family HTH domain